MLENTIHSIELVTSIVTVAHVAVATIITHIRNEVMDLHMYIFCQPSNKDYSKTVKIRKEFANITQMIKKLREIIFRVKQISQKQTCKNLMVMCKPQKTRANK